MFPGWELSRTIPADVILRLFSGEYKIYGGVIRWAAGTENAGQIVRHLIPVGPQFLNVIPGLNFIPGIVESIEMSKLAALAQQNTHQLVQLSNQIGTLSQATHQLLQITSGTAVLSGLGLALSSVGFVAINNKLNTIDCKLKDIQKDIQAIQQFLEGSERAKIFAALDSLLKLEKTPSEHRHTILHNARQTLAEINMRYRELLFQATRVETAMLYEEYFALTALAQIRCTAELGMLVVAQHEIQETNQVWQNQGRRIATELLLGKYPERFLASDFAKSVSVVELMEWMDFAKGGEKGYGWIDEFRSKLDKAWYAKGWIPTMHGGSGLNKNIGVGLEKEQTMVIPVLRKLVARSRVFEGYVAQYDLLVEQNLLPSAFEQKIMSLCESSVVDGYFILKPAK